MSVSNPSEAQHRLCNHSIDCATRLGLKVKSQSRSTEGPDDCPTVRKLKRVFMHVQHSNASKAENLVSFALFAALGLILGHKGFEVCPHFTYGSSLVCCLFIGDCCNDQHKTCKEDMFINI